MSTEDTPPATGSGKNSTETPTTPGRRGRGPLVVASMAAAVLLVGGGAAYWASGAAGQDGEGGAGAAADPPPLALEGYGQSHSGNSGNSGIAPGEPNPQGAGYRAVADLPDGPADAPVYRPQGPVGKAAVAKLAKALDVSGQIRSEGGTWKVGGQDKDSRGPVLQVAKAGTGSWTFAQYGTPGGVNCALPAAPKGKEADAKTGHSSDGPGCPSYRGREASTEDDGSGKGAVSQEKAKQAVQPVLAALGQEDAKLDAGGLSGAVRIVSANPVFGGLPTYGWQSDLQVGSDGRVVGGSGQLARPVKGDTYPVLSAAKTLEHLNGGAGSAGGTGRGEDKCATPLPNKGEKGEKGQQGDDRGDKGDKGVAPCEPAPGKPSPAEVTGARFGLSVQFVNGSQALVPSWMYEVRQPGSTGGKDSRTTVAHPAVDPKFVVDRNAGDAATQRPAQPPQGGKEGEKGAQSLESYAVSKDGKKLTLRFWGGVCSDYSASADQSGTAVTAQVTGKEKKPGGVCVKIAKQFTETVTLDSPLDGREVIDASSGETVPQK
ncbi:hypothetical protein [Streptomyces niger]|uniref:hypothetical protein n=1 Tax=Streptomyces niger TaxID=66373 RepID=UPI00069C7208|nr:hypothetical protein [Streptomyces niger]